MTLPDDLAAWRPAFLAETGLSMADLVNDGFESLSEAEAERVGQASERIPAHYAAALATDPGIREWMGRLLRQAVADRRMACSVTTGRSLLVLGQTGTVKTHQAFGAIRGIACCGVRARWRAISAADLYARMRPRHGIDSEAEFREFADASLLVLDDLGAAKNSEWVEEVNYRLVNRRYEHSLPTLFTSNIRPGDLAAALGDRVASRLNEMSDRIVLEGADRRYGDAA